MSTTSTTSRRWQEVVRFADLLLRAAERDPDREAVVFPAGRVTYGELSGGPSRWLARCARSESARAVGWGS